MILFFETIIAIELISPIFRGDLGYNDLECDAINLSELFKGQVFYWPELLVSRDLPRDYKADFQASVQGSDTEMGDYFDEDEVIKNARINNNKAR